MEEYKYLFESAFGKYLDISAPALEYLNESFLLKEFPQRSLITESGSTEKFFYLVVSGVQVIYLLNRNGEKVVLGFSFDGSLSGVYDSFICQKPSDFFLEALTETKMIAINHAKYQRLFDLFPEFKSWRIATMEGIFFGRSKREVEILTLSAKERFDAFMERCPPPLMHIPQKFLASYLNMKPETFSRMRAIRD